MNPNRLIAPNSTAPTRGATRALRLAATCVAACALLACGGGGSGAPSPTTAPGSDAAHQPVAQAEDHIDGHFERLNEVRAAMGLPVLAWNEALARSAALHADYQQAHGVQDHGEVPGTAGFTGMGWGDRDRAAGYSGNLVGEVIVGGSASTVSDGRALMDVLLAAPGHRFVLLGPEFVDAGIAGLPLTTELGSPAPHWIAPDRVYLYPYNGQNNVLTSFAPASESPNPLPGILSTGMPLSVHAGMFSSFTVTAMSLVNAQTGLPVALLPNADIGQQRSAFVAYPASPLAPSTSYTFRVDLQIASQNRTVSGSFTTGAN